MHDCVYINCKYDEQDSWTELKTLELDTVITDNLIWISNVYTILLFYPFFKLYLQDSDQWEFARLMDTNLRLNQSWD